MKVVHNHQYEQKAYIQAISEGYTPYNKDNAGGDAVRCLGLIKSLIDSMSCESACLVRESLEGEDVYKVFVK